MNSRHVSRVGVTVIAAAALTLAGCTNSADDQASNVSSAMSSATSAMESASNAASESMDAPLEIRDGFVKAKPAEKPMTGIFGTLANTGDTDITVESFSSSLDGVGKYEIHETVDGSMRMKEGGIVIPAGGTYELKPGGDHLMLMDIAAPIEAGDTVDLMLKTADGKEITIKDLPVRTIGSGEEDYGSDGGVQGDSGMEHMDSSEANTHEGHNH
ncbi:copper chaperone PCu(A)C [Corynebacterium sp.]|uniref:copper chaperone PCu(A)C n=1 Tax=Corynebacterium sp. TaxID=1720 RepID=UPI0026DC1138|nr:copper chaperone PCu(A)C [Corynebacterium sp.]MDO5077995.1 copper chaperone PCu(A)C [Corynebacterium sp.]